jgi:hypothetical protein
MARFEDFMNGRVKGDTLVRIWRTFRTRGHDHRVRSRLPEGLSRELDSGYIVATEWYPIDLYLALYGSLLALTSYAEVVATAHESVMVGLTQGTWKVFVPVLAGLAPTAFAERAARRFEIVYRVTFDPGEAKVTLVADGADVLVSPVPWSPSLAWRGGVSGGLLTIPTLARLEGDCQAAEAEDGHVLFRLRWRKS